MTDNQLIPGGQVGRRDDGVDLLERYFEQAEPADDLRGRDLVGVATVASHRIDVGRLQQADAVVVAQGLDVK